MAKYAKIGNKFYTVGDQSQLQEISAGDIIGRRGDIGGKSATLERIRAEGDIMTIDPSQVQFGPQGEVLIGGKHLSLGGSQAYSRTGLTGLPINQDFSNYLRQTSQIQQPKTRSLDNFRGFLPGILPNIQKISELPLEIRKAIKRISPQIDIDITTPDKPVRTGPVISAQPNIKKISDLPLKVRQGMKQAFPDLDIDITTPDRLSTGQVPREALFGNQTAGITAQEIISEALGPKPFTELSPEAQFYRAQGKLPSGGQDRTTGQISGNIGLPEADLSGLPPEWANLYTQLENYLKELEKRGQMINPNVKITPEQVVTFTKQAENEIDPYFKNQATLFREQFLREQGFSREQVLQSEMNLERQFGRATRQIGEQAAERGFALSGGRIREERELTGDVQRQVEQGRRQLGFQAGGQALQFASRFGIGALPSLNIGEAPRALAGQGTFERGARELPFYQLSPETFEALQTGTEEFARRGAIQTRALELEEAERARQSLVGLRSLTL